MLCLYHLCILRCDVFNVSRMKFTISPLIYGGCLLSFCTLAFVGSATISSRMASKNALTARQQGLQLVAQNYMADTCWTVRSPESYKIGDRVQTEGSLLGRIPTSCIKSSKTNQILHVVYADGELIVKHAYSPTELKNQVSAIKKGLTNGN